MASHNSQVLFVTCSFNMCILNLLFADCVVCLASVISAEYRNILQPSVSQSEMLTCCNVQSTGGTININYVPFQQLLQCTAMQ